MNSNYSMSHSLKKKIIITENIELLRKNGLVKIPSFLDEVQTKKISSIISKYQAKKGSKESQFAINYFIIFKKFLKLNFINLFENLSVLNICNSLNLKEFSEKYFNTKVYVSMIDGYYSFKDVNSPIIPWHTDQAASGASAKDIKKYVNPDDFTLKFFIYLTDVYKNNGCMSYIPESHKITYLIRKGIFEGKLDYAPYWSIAQLQKFIANKKNKNYIIANLDEIFLFDKFEENIDKIIKKNNDQEFDYSMQAGDAIIFNEGLIHKGSKLLYTDRKVLRFHFKPILN
jgi:hypothetical protein